MNPLLDSRSMRFKPWMLAPRSKAKAGLWNALPPPALAALTSAHPSPMVRGYLLNGSWPGASGVRPSFAAPEPNQEPEPPTDIRPEPKQEAEPPTNTQPEPPPEPRAKAETSSLSLTIRVVEPMEEEEARPAELPPKQSRWRRLLRAVQRKAP